MQMVCYWSCFGLFSHPVSATYTMYRRTLLMQLRGAIMTDPELMEGDTSSYDAGPLHQVLKDSWN